MKKFLILLVSGCIMATVMSNRAEAQINRFFYHNLQNPGTGIPPQYGQGANINVVYQRCTWRIHPDSPTVASPAKYLRGNVLTRFVTLQNNTSQVSFDFNNVHTIDSVKYHNSRLPAGNIVWITSKIIQLTFPSPIANAGTLDSLTIYYRGTPPAVSGEALGYQRGVSSSDNYVYTLSESYEDRDWWPCKHDMMDKIDSMDIIVSVPSAFWVATNGKMTDSSISGSNRVFTFKHRYPIASYLVSLGVAKYSRYYRTPVNIGGTNVPVVYNLFPGKTTSKINSILNALDKSRTELVEFSNKYGDYPFKNEKHGYYEFGWGGGMEHQTFSAMGGSALTSWSAIAHELSHQWFGDKVTCATWHDLWINEGFARYNEILAAELVSGLTNPVTYRGSIKSAARSISTTPVYISDISSSNTIWTSNNGTAVYERGCMIVSMLRSLLGDTGFFGACRDYLNDPTLTYQAAATADVERNFENRFGLNLGEFFNAWVYGYGNPSYAVNWSTTGNNITFQLNQSRSTGTSVSYFPMPVVLKVSSNGNGSTTTLIMYDRGDSIFLAGNGVGTSVAGNSITFNLAFQPASVSFDPNNETMATGTTTKVSAFTGRPGVNNGIVENLIFFYPNPVNNELVIQDKSGEAGKLVRILDQNGKLVLTKTLSNATEKINTQKLTSGNYIIEIRENNVILKTEKLVIVH